MIGYLVGTARVGNLVMTPGGVGYVVSSVRPFTAGEAVELFVHTHTSREGAVTLYGFDDETEQRLFLSVTAVTGVGGAIALTLLRELGTDTLANAISEKDVKALSSVRGVGTKVAEKIIAMVKLPKDLPLSGATNGSADPVIAVLRELGYSNEEAWSAVAVIGREGDDDTRLARALDEIRKAQR